MKLSDVSISDKVKLKVDEQFSAIDNAYNLGLKDALKTMKVYLIVRSSGMWDDYDSWVHAVYLNKEKAEQLIVKKNTQIDRLKEYSIKFADDDDHPQWLRHINICNLGKFTIIEHDVVM